MVVPDNEDYTIAPYIIWMSGGRLKPSGMFWTVGGANSIIDLRCSRLSGSFEDFWEARGA